MMVAAKWNEDFLQLSLCEMLYQHIEEKSTGMRSHGRFYVPLSGLHLGVPTASINISNSQREKFFQMSPSNLYSP